MPKPWSVPFEWGPEQVSARRLFTSSALFVVVVATYLIGVVHLARASLIAHAILAVGVPLLLWLGGLFDEVEPRILQLVKIETGYNLLAVSSKIALTYGWHDAATVIGYGFGLWFLTQVGGFIAFELKERMYTGVAQSLMLGAAIFVWMYSAPDLAGAIDADGRFLMWGEDAPLAVRIMYCTWVVHAMVGDMNDVYLRSVLLHSVSVTIAMLSGAFFHVRLLTAGHFFALDLGFRVTALPSDVGRDDFAQLTVPQRRWVYRYVRPVVIGLTVVSTTGVAIAALVLGLDLGL